MKEWVTEHRVWCKSKDNSKVMWDEETDETRCGECGVLSEERDSEVEAQMTPEVTDGHET